MVLHVRTLFANAVAPILQQLDATLLKHARSASHTLLFSIAPSASLPADDLSQLVSYFQALKHERVGALSAPMTVVDRTGHDSTGTWCSVAIFDKQTATAFRSNIPGRPDAQVGRWHAARKTEERQVHVPRAAEGPWSWNAPLYPLPDSLQTLTPDDVGSVLYFSDNAPERLASSLSGSFKKAYQFGLVSSSTPFLTGRPFTLFHNTNILSSGAVGLCLHSSDNPDWGIDFPPELHQLTDDLEVTEMEGNLIHSLDDKNPSRLLLDAINKDVYVHGLSEHKCYVGIFDGPELRGMYTILSGDPSRGSIALEGENAPSEGSIVRIFSLPRPIGARKIMVPQTGKLLEFMTTGGFQSFSTATGIDARSSACTVIENKFQACSENGVVVSLKTSRGPGTPWRVNMPGLRLYSHWG